MTLLILFAFVAGFVTILSPCILPILPIVLSSSIGDRKTGKARPVGVIVGFILSFTFFTLFLSSLVKIIGISPNFFRYISIVVIIVSGLSLIIPQFQTLVEKLFTGISRVNPKRKNRTGFYGGLWVGLSIGLLWTPCVGPILASVISLAIIGTVTLDAFWITLSYSIGTAIPMLLVMLGGQNLLHKAPWLMANLQNIQKVFGVMLIVTAIAILLNYDRKFQTFVLTTFPKYGTGLTWFENNSQVQKQIDTNLGYESSSKNIGKPSFELIGAKGVKAPEIIPGGEWINTQPLTLGELKGKVVIIDFWTYSCINCQRTFPYLKSWYQKYKDKGLVIIGVHSPEFEFEKSLSNVNRAIKDFGLSYPIVQDNNFDTWRAFNNRYWPAKYFIDKDGDIRYTHFGEGNYDESEKVIQDLLAETGVTNANLKINNPEYTVQTKTPELYLGYGRISNLASVGGIRRDVLSNYLAPKNLGSNEFSFAGDWMVTEEYANPHKGAALTLNFDAKEVYLVMRTKAQPAKIKVFVDGVQEFFGDDYEEGVVTVDADKLYKLINLPSSGGHILRLEFEDDNVELYAFTFG